jgi:RsiW-degrading membrane proteinase PrsW (M82 family)
MLDVLRWIIPAFVPAGLLAALVWRTDKVREPPHVVIGTFVLSMGLALVSFFIEGRARSWTGLDIRTAVAGNSGSLLFLFALVAPLRETAKVAACWPAFKSKHFDEPYDGVVYASASALGFAAIENAILLRANPGAIALLRAALALPAHLFFASAWGYALGRTKRSRDPGARFPALWFVSMAMHGFYIHFVHARGPLAMIVTLPLLGAMGIVTVLAARDLRRRGESLPADPMDRLSRASIELMSSPPSLRTMRRALRDRERPVAVGWVLLGTAVTLGAMVVGVAGAVAFGRYANVDFSVVDEQNVSTVAPVALLGSGLLAAFPLSGFLIARASSLPTLIEPALATALAIVLVLVLLGAAAPVALVFAVGLSPIAWGLACLGAWLGRPSS